jgi:non-specific serine/threonine protein kinase
VAATRAELGDDAFAAAMAAGRTMPLDRVADVMPLIVGSATVAERAGEAPTGPARPDTTAPSAAGRQTIPLTRREREVATLVARGLTDRQIAETLVIAEGTVGVHLTNIFSKLALHARAQLAVWAAEHGLLDE